jgi:hypothetical protein
MNRILFEIILIFSIIVVIGLGLAYMAVNGFFYLASVLYLVVLFIIWYLTFKNEWDGYRITSCFSEVLGMFAMTTFVFSWLIPIVDVKGDIVLFIIWVFVSGCLYYEVIRCIDRYKRP